jgi:hypothetical protein
MKIGIFHNDTLLNQAAFQRHKEMVMEYLKDVDVLIEDRYRQITVNGVKYVYGTVARLEDAYAYAGVEFQAVFCNTVCEEAAQYLLSRFRPK